MAVCLLNNGMASLVGLRGSYQAIRRLHLRDLYADLESGGDWQVWTLTDGGNIFGGEFGRPIYNQTAEQAGWYTVSSY